MFLSTVIATIRSHWRTHARPATPARKFQAVLSVERLEDRTVPASASANKQFIINAYQSVLERNPDAAGLNNFAAQMQHGASKKQIIKSLVKSVEFNQRQVMKLYNKYLRRGTDAAGLKFYTAYLENGGSLDNVRTIFLNSQEYFQKRGKNNGQGFLGALYDDILNRKLDSVGLFAHGHKLNKNGARLQLIKQLLYSEEAQQQTVKDYYKNYLDRDADQAGLNAMVSELAKSHSREAVLYAILTSTEFSSKNSSSSWSSSSNSFDSGYSF